ncbi:hypothetical protein Val02_93540 [Virgisporangium aliadipatigenens]|uniref:Uncharacterized protein n=1 Tax=Virgisporangium aliadipatigenens TaxID=741659 RepID=A0A8J4DWN7_9ACTN|nr:hypothetical protein [Virgisporangium aliadipatigenens]GIJ52468.1 hypothetical protein Val02_93540 [Virgisporangium aliadipatigenens]
MQPTENLSIDLPVGEDCPTCKSWHRSDEPHWYLDCRTCGGAFIFGGSAEPECGACASAPELHDDDPEESESDEEVAEAESYGERLLENYQAAMEARDVAGLLDGDPGDSDSEVGFSPANTLRDMVLYTDRYGWVQGDYYDRTAVVLFPPACIVAGLGMVCYGERVDAPALHFEHPGFGEFEAAMAWLERYLVDRFPDGDDNGNPMTAYGFNDARGRTYEEVRAVVLAAADLWERIYQGPVPGPECCGMPMPEAKTSPEWSEATIFDRSVVERVFQCPTCRRWEYVEVTDKLERDCLIALALSVPGGAE